MRRYRAPRLAHDPASVLAGWLVEPLEQLDHHVQRHGRESILHRMSSSCLDANEDVIALSQCLTSDLVGCDSESNFALVSDRNCHTWNAQDVATHLGST